MEAAESSGVPQFAESAGNPSPRAATTRAFAGKGHNVEADLRAVSHGTSILDGDLFSISMETEAARLTLQLPKHHKKRKTVQLMRVTEKLWKS